MKMKFSNLKYMAVAIALSMTASSCGDFLDRPTEDSYNEDNYYDTDDQCISATNYLYNSPWYDFQRGFIKVGEVLSGNYYWGSSPYLTFTVNGSDEDLINMSYSLWAAIGHSNMVYNNISKSKGSEAAKLQAMGECLVWKAMGYFFLVRTFGEVPIVHDNKAELTSGQYQNAQKIQKPDVYEYIVMTLEKAIEDLEKSSETLKIAEGRLDQWSAKGLLAKVYLSKAGVTGTVNQSDLDNAAKYAKMVIDHFKSTGKGFNGSGLEENYEDVFKLANRKTQEGLIVWRWTADGENWTRQNSYQSDLAINGIDDWGATWGGWNGLSVDLQKAFGVDLAEGQPDSWLSSLDSRLHATMMLPGFSYDQFWQDRGGFDYLNFIYEGRTIGDKTYKSVTGSLESATGSNTVKHIYGDTFDHQQGAGCSDGRMASSVPTFLLRLSDVYLVYAEAMLGASNIGPGSAPSTNPEVIDAYSMVHQRAVKSVTTKPASVSWDDIWKERRLEFAMEGDRWYDYVRVSYYNPDFCISDIKSQQRNALWNLDDCYKNYYKTGKWDNTNVTYDTKTAVPNPVALMKKDKVSGKQYFCLPFPSEDVVFNPNLGSNVDGIHVDVRQTYSY